MAELLLTLGWYLVYIHNSNPQKQPTWYSRFKNIIDYMTSHTQWVEGMKTPIGNTIRRICWKPNLPLMKMLCVRKLIHQVTYNVGWVMGTFQGTEWPLCEDTGQGQQVIRNRKKSKKKIAAGSMPNMDIYFLSVGIVQINCRWHTKSVKSHFVFIFSHCWSFRINIINFNQGMSACTSPHP